MRILFVLSFVIMFAQIIAYNSPAFLPADISQEWLERYSDAIYALALFGGLFLLIAGIVAITALVISIWKSKIRRDFCAFILISSITGIIYTLRMGFLTSAH